ncbi:MAG: DUF3109 family protein [Microscillaceae bacterium]|nr:DUF3109 family protein [Microscillaceae bacterium]
MYVIGNTYISDDIVEEFFVCDLEKCKGACCVEGDLGAPLEKEELPIIEAIYEKVKPYLTSKGIAAIEKQGTFIRDYEGDFSTPTINGKECAYAFYDKRGILKCGIEAAYRDGKIDFQKPISCHIYPIRISKIGEDEALNYNQWNICAPACRLGAMLSQPIYKFLKEALIRKYGEAWYAELEQLVEENKGN